MFRVIKGYARFARGSLSLDFGPTPGCRVEASTAALRSAAVLNDGDEIELVVVDVREDGAVYIHGEVVNAVIYLTAFTKEELLAGLESL